MRNLIFLLAFLGAVLAVVDVSWSTQCTETCEPTVWTGIAIPNCTAPVCEVQCADEVDPEDECDDIEETLEECIARCDITACFDEVPPCEIQCREDLECDDDVSCEIVCEELLCNWIFVPGPDKPTPVCNLTCEAVTCETPTTSTPTTSDSGRFSLFFF